MLITIILKFISTFNKILNNYEIKEEEIKLLKEKYRKENKKR